MESISEIAVMFLGKIKGMFSNPVLSLDGGYFYPVGQGGLFSGPSLGVTQAAFTSADQSGSAAAVTDAPPAGLTEVITDIRFSSDTALHLDFTDSGNSKLLFREYVGANSGGQITLRGKVKLSAPGAQLKVQASAAGNISVTASYYSEP